VNWIESLILIERIDDPIAIGPHFAVVINVDTVGHPRKRAASSQ